MENENQKKSQIYEAILKFRSLKLEERVSSIELIPEIIKNLGKDRAVSEFFPYLFNTTKLSEKHWKLIIENICKIDFSEFSIDDIKRLLEDTQFLTEADSSIIRNSFGELVSKLANIQNDEITNEIIPKLIENPLENNWEFAQMTGLSIIPKIISQISNKKRLVDSSLPLSESDTTNIRQNFVKMCEEIVGFLEEPEVHILFDKIKILLEDSQASVLREIPKFYASYASRLNSYKEILEPLKSLVQHSNWSVRCTAMTSLSKVFKDRDISFNEIYEFMLIGAKDQEDEIRIATCQQLPFIAQMRDIDKEKLQDLLDSYLLKDTNQHCLASITTSLPLFSKHLGMAYTTKNVLDAIPSQSREVKLAAIEALKSEHIHRETAIECIISIAQSQFAQSKYWREIQSIIETLPAFIDGIEVSSNFFELIKLLLNNPASKVRLSTVKILPLLSEKLKENFTTQIVPIIKELFEDNDYNLRQVAIRAVIECNLNDKFGLKILDDATKDPVSNVRLTLAKYISREHTETIKKLKNDKDPDVRDFANQPQWC